MGTQITTQKRYFGGAFPHIEKHWNCMLLSAQQEGSFNREQCRSSMTFFVSKEMLHWGGEIPCYLGSKAFRTPVFWGGA